MNFFIYYIHGYSQLTINKFEKFESSLKNRHDDTKLVTFFRKIRHIL